MNVPIADVDEVAGDGGSGGHLGRHKVSAATAALAAFKVTVAGGGATLTRRKNVWIHPKAHGAARFAPVEAGFDEDSIEAFGFRRCFDRLGTGDDHRTYVR